MTSFARILLLGAVLASAQAAASPLHAQTAEMTKHNILMNAGTAVLTQANNVPKLALSLLQNS